jgi:hypothetical protein
MLQFQEYSMAWLVYVLAIIGLLIVTWRLFRAVPSAYIRRMIIITVAVLFITPVISESSYWAPAWIVAALEFLFSGVDGMMGILNILLSVWCVAIVLYSAVHIAFFRKNKAHAPKKAAIHKTPRRMANKRVTPS